ncbi:hypothetical protein ACVWWO_009376 [Bradyrhizobium sp. F1.13.1]
MTKMRRPSATNAFERALVDDHHLDVLLLQTGDAQDRAGVFAQQLLGLGVAQDRRPLRLRMRGRERRQRDRSRRDEGDERGGLLAQCDLEQHQAVWVKGSCQQAGQAFLVEQFSDWFWRLAADRIRDMPF